MLMVTSLQPYLLTTAVLPVLILCVSTQAATISFSGCYFVYINRATVNILVVANYRPNFLQVNSTLFGEFSDHVKCVASKAAPVFIVAEVNIRLDDSLFATTAIFKDIVSGCNMK